MEQIEEHSGTRSCGDIIRQYLQLVIRLPYYTPPMREINRIISGLYSVISISLIRPIDHPQTSRKRGKTTNHLI